MASLPLGLKLLMAIVIGVSVPEGFALLFGPPEFYTLIWGWSLTAMTARFTAGLYLTVALGFLMAWRAGTWEAARIPLAMLWSFALVALVSALHILGTGNTAPAGGPIIFLDRPFTAVWFFLYVVSVAGGLYYHLAYARKIGAKPF